MRSVSGASGRFRIQYMEHQAESFSHHGYGEGRLVRGLRLTGQSWTFVRERPRLLVLPGLAAVASVLSMVAIQLPILYFFSDDNIGLAMGLCGAVAALPLTFITVFFNVGFLKMVEADLRGESPTVGYGLRAARARGRQILGWAILSAAVGALFRALEQLPVVGGWAGQALSLIGGLAWSLATFFIVPVLALEGLGPVASMRRSASVFRSSWGETVTGDVAIGFIAAFLFVPGVFGFVFAAFAFHDHSYAVGLSVGAAGIALAAIAAAVTSALVSLFQYFVYRDLMGVAPAGPFTKQDLASAVKPKKRFR